MILLTDGHPRFAFTAAGDILCIGCGGSWPTPRRTTARFLLWFQGLHADCRQTVCGCSGSGWVNCACAGATLDCPICDGDGMISCECWREITN